MQSAVKDVHLRDDYARTCSTPMLCESKTQVKWGSKAIQEDMGPSRGHSKFDGLALYCQSMTQSTPLARYLMILPSEIAHGMSRIARARVDTMVILGNSFGIAGITDLLCTPACANESKWL